MSWPYSDSRGHKGATKGRKNSQEFKLILSHIASSRQSHATWNTVSEQINRVRINSIYTYSPFPNKYNWTILSETKKKIPEGWLWYTNFHSWAFLMTTYTNVSRSASPFRNAPGVTVHIRACAHAHTHSSTIFTHCHCFSASLNLQI